MNHSHSCREILRKQLGNSWHVLLPGWASSHEFCDNCQDKTAQAMLDNRAMLLELLDSLPTELQKAAFVQSFENLRKLSRREIKTAPPCI